MRKGTLVIYVDESGTPHVFGKQGRNLVEARLTSRHFVVASVRCTDPSALGRCVTELAAWADSSRRKPLGYIHASDDTTETRLRVCEELGRLPIKATAIVMDKQRLDAAREWMHDPTRFYNDVLSYLLSQSLHVYEQTHVMLSAKSFDTREQHQAMVDSIIDGFIPTYEARLAAGAPAPTAVRISVDRARRRPGLQAADYVAWAVLRAFELQDLRYYRLVEPIVSHLYDIGQLRHYSRRRPLENPP